ncbi:MAG TPA: DsbC family protein [Gammaproteobacteria bacterium]
MNKSWIAVSLILAAPLAGAEEGAPLTKEDLAAALKGVEVGDISESPVPGVYQVAVGADVAYVTSDGRYLLEGELYDLKTNRNLTEQTREEARVDLLASVDPATMIVFKPEDGVVKHTITVFTDVDCGYCRQFHRDIAEVNALGIEVHYLFYPRTGPDTESWAKAEKVWCSADRNAALTRAKLGGSLPDATCGETPVAMHYDLGHRMGLRGTPAIYSSTGEHLGGYLPPATLIRVLDESAQ